MLARKIKEKDLFSVPVQLTYKGDRDHQTFVGGCCSIMLLMTTIIWFVVGVLSVLSNPTFTSDASMYYEKYGPNVTAYNLTEFQSIAGSMTSTDRTETIVDRKFRI